MACSYCVVLALLTVCESRDTPRRTQGRKFGKSTRDELVREVVKAYDGVTEEEVLPGIVAFEKKLRSAGIIAE